MNKKYSQGYQFQVNYTLSRDLSDDDNERDPFIVPLRAGRQPRARVQLLRSRPAPPLQRLAAHHLQGLRVQQSASRARSAQPRSIGNTPQDRIQPDGTIIKRNTLRKDNEFFSWDLRVTRDFKVGGAIVQPIFEVFNLTNARNIREPEVTNLVFNFDGTVQSGLGDPRQAQFGVRVQF